MEVRVKITKYRVALAALFVLAGVGLGNLLSPLVGSALATVGQTVNISDHSASANFAKVDSGGKLAVGDGGGSLTVDGAVTATEATPKNFAMLNLGGSSVPGGVCKNVTFPAGKALIIKSIFTDLYQEPVSSDQSMYWALRKGTTCSGPDIIAEHPQPDIVGKTIPIEPGFGVPASPGGLSLFLTNPTNTTDHFGITTYVYGYWVPASAV
jgi:hypothetical protein